MSTKKNISPSVDEAKLRIELYNKLTMNLKDLKRDEVRTVLAELDIYVKLLVSKSKLNDLLYLHYCTCCSVVFQYLYRTRQLKMEGGIPSEVLKHVNDVFTTILKDYDAS